MVARNSVRQSVALLSTGSPLRSAVESSPSGSVLGRECAVLWFYSWLAYEGLEESDLNKLSVAAWKEELCRGRYRGGHELRVLHRALTVHALW